MTTITAVRANLAEICNNIDGGWYGQAHVVEQMNPGCIVVSRPSFDPRMVLSLAKVEYNFRLVAYASRAGGEASEDVLDYLCAMTGPGSLIEAVQESDNWTETVDYAEVVLIGETQVVTYGDDTVTQYLACPFDIKVVF